MYRMLIIASLSGSPGQADQPRSGYDMIGIGAARATYKGSLDESVRRGVPLVVFVRCGPFDVPGAVTCRYDALDGYDAGVVVAVPDRRVGVAWKATLPPTATQADVLRELGVTPVRVPFRESPADGSWLRRQLPFLFDLEEYDTAKRVQYTERRDVGYIHSYERKAAKAKWNVPGGLLGVGGWSSQLLKKAKMSVSLARSNGDAIVWRPRYEDGAVFADVLRNDAGTIFEVRVAEKGDGAWDRYVAYRDPSAYPAGYVPLKRGSCAGCHSEAGEATYGKSAAVPGGDTVISGPIPQVESGEYVQGGSGLRL